MNPPLSNKSLFTLVLQSARTVSKPGHTLLCEVPSTYMATHTFSSSSHTRSRSLYVSLSRAHNFERTERGSREEGLAAAMKDSDEGAAVKHTVDAIYLLMEREHIRQTRCLFKFSLCQQEPNKDQAQKRTFTRPCGSYMNEHKQTHTTLSLQLRCQFHGGKNPNKDNWAPGLLIMSSSHMHYCTIGGLPCHGSLRAVRFLLGKAALAKNISLMMSDFIPDPYNFTNTDLLQIIMHYACVYPMIMWCLLVRLCICKNLALKYES